MEENYYDLFDELKNLEEIETGKIKIATLLEVGGVHYPKFGNIVILAGAPGGGKSFQLKNLIGIDGKILSEDRLMELITQIELFIQEMQQEGIILTHGWEENQSKLEAVRSFIHKKKFNERIIKNLRYVKNLEQRKPNLIFDGTLSNAVNFYKICNIAKKLKYDKRNIHLIWVINPLEVCLKQNQNRARKLSDDTIRAIFRGVSTTMNEICTLGDNLKEYLDGDIWISFNQIDIDVFGTATPSGNFVYDKAKMVKIKPQGGTIQFLDKDKKDISKDIFEYTQDKNWLF